MERKGADMEKFSDPNGFYGIPFLRGAKLPKYLSLNDVHDIRQFLIYARICISAGYILT